MFSILMRCALLLGLTITGLPAQPALATAVGVPALPGKPIVAAEPALAMAPLAGERCCATINGVTVYRSTNASEVHTFSGTHSIRRGSAGFVDPASCCRAW